MLRILYPNKYDRSNQHVSFLTHGWFPFVKRLFLEYLSAPCHSISLWCDVSQQTYDFLGSTNAVLLFPLFGTPWWRFSKGWSLKTVHFSGIFGIQLIVNVQCWILMASAVYKNLEQLLKISNQVECHESGMSRSNSKKSYVDVQTLVYHLNFPLVGWCWARADVALVGWACHLFPCSPSLPGVPETDWLS